MKKVVINEEILYKTIENSIIKVLNESEYDEGFKDSLGRAFGAVKRGVKNGLGWVRDRVSQIGNSVSNVGYSQPNRRQYGTTDSIQQQQVTHSKYGPQPLPELTPDVSQQMKRLVYKKKAEETANQKFMEFLNQKKSDGLTYNAETRQFTGENPGEVAKANQEIKKLYDAWEQIHNANQDVLRQRGKLNEKKFKNNKKFN